MIGAPVALMALLLYPVLLFTGYLMAGFGLADMVQARHPDAPTPGRRVLGFGVAIVILVLLSVIPWIGGLVAVLALLFGLGAFIRAAAIGRRQPMPVG